MANYFDTVFITCLIIATILSFYTLVYKLYHNEHRAVRSWHFPMLFAILLESFMP